MSALVKLLPVVLLGGFCCFCFKLFSRMALSFTERLLVSVELDIILFFEAMELVFEEDDFENDLKKLPRDPEFAGAACC